MPRRRLVAADAAVNRKFMIKTFFKKRRRPYYINTHSLVSWRLESINIISERLFWLLLFMGKKTRGEMQEMNELHAHKNRTQAAGNDRKENRNLKMFALLPGAESRLQ